jgi:hypothetical protein
VSLVVAEEDMELDIHWNMSKGRTLDHKCSRCSLLAELDKQFCLYQTGHH